MRRLPRHSTQALAARVVDRFRLYHRLPDLAPSADPDHTEDQWHFEAANGHDDWGTEANYDWLLETYLRMGSPFRIQRLPAHDADPWADGPAGIEALTAAERNPSMR